MNSKTSSPPILCIDLKKNRIRIHRTTLAGIGNPDYIQLLVNPKTAKIAVRPSTRKDYLAHKIYPSSIDCYELYSTDLINRLLTVNEGLERNCSYRLYGSIYESDGVALFPMTDPVLIKE